MFQGVAVGFRSVTGAFKVVRGVSGIFDGVAGAFHRGLKMCQGAPVDFSGFKEC